MEAKLADRHFFRSNSCYLVNLKHVTGVMRAPSSNTETVNCSPVSLW